MAPLNVLVTLLVFASCSDLSHGDSIVKEVSDGVRFTGLGSVDLQVSNDVSFTFPKTCQGTLRICYAAESTLSSDGQGSLQNVDVDCPSGYCMINFEPRLARTSDIMQVRKDGNNIVATFDQDIPDVCPLKTVQGLQTFQVLELPECDVTMNGASLPKVIAKTTSTVEPATMEDVTDASKTNLLNWFVPVCVGVIVLLLAAGALGYMVYSVNRDFKNANVPNAKKASRRQKNVAAISPMTGPTVSPDTPTIPTTPKNPTPETPKQETDAKTENTTLTPTTTAPLAATASKIVSPLPVIVLLAFDLLIEEAARSLYRNNLLRFFKNSLDAFLNMVQRNYVPKSRRLISTFEIDFFLLFVSQAYKEATELIKNARQNLCHHGAVFEHGQWRFFSDTTRDYIRKPSTPGFTAWYAFACEHGNGIKFDDDVSAEAILKKLSVSALLTVFFRENIRDQIRRSAYAHLRRALVPISKKFKESELYAMPYPLCLIPDMRKKNPALFEDAANDKTYSTPLEKIHQRFKDEATVENGLTDETQVSYTDGKSRMGEQSVQVQGSKMATTVTV